jgi:hypothetical protein
MTRRTVAERAALNGPAAWDRYSATNRVSTFVYDHTREHTKDLLNNGGYGVVQLVCITLTARAAFMAGYRAAQRQGRVK